MNQITNNDFNLALQDKNNISIINSLKKKYRKYIPSSELDNASLIALWNTLKNYDPTKGRKFTSYLYKMIEWEFNSWITKDRRSKKHNHKELINEVSYDNTELIEFRDILSSMPQNLAVVIEQKYLYNMTFKEIAKKNNYSHETARQRLKDGIKYLHNARTMCD